MLLNEIIILQERIINLFSAEQKEKYAAEIWTLLQQAYKPAGGFLSASGIPELIASTGLWKLITRNGKVTAVNIYKDKFGRKSVASGTDGTQQGKKDYLLLKSEDVKFQRSWAEVSGAPEKILKKMGAEPIPAEYAPVLLGKEILSYNPDGFHYTRLIAGEPHEKVIYGFIELTPELQRKLEAAEIDVKKLPKSIQAR